MVASLFLLVWHGRLCVVFFGGAAVVITGSVQRAARGAANGRREVPLQAGSQAGRRECIRTYDIFG